jgi:hypothetical protein
MQVLAYDEKFKLVNVRDFLNVSADPLMVLQEKWGCLAYEEKYKFVNVKDFLNVSDNPLLVLQKYVHQGH